MSDHILMRKPDQLMIASSHKLGHDLNLGTSTDMHCNSSAYYCSAM